MESLQLQSSTSTVPTESTSIRTNDATTSRAITKMTSTSGKVSRSQLEVIGTISMEVSDASLLQTPAAVAALQNSIAAALPGVSADMIKLTVSVLGSRRLWDV